MQYAANRVTAVDSALTSASLILVAEVHNAKRHQLNDRRPCDLGHARVT